MDRGDYRLVKCFDWYDIGSKRIMSLTDRNSICEVDILNGEARCIGQYPKKENSTQELSMTVQCVDDFLVFTPTRAENIAILNTRDYSFEFIDTREVLHGLREEVKDQRLFVSSFKWGKNVFFMGWSVPLVIRFDTEKKLLKRIDIETDGLNIRDYHSNYYWFGFGHVQNENVLYFPVCCGNYIFGFDAENLTYEFISVSDRKMGFGCLKAFGKDIWLSDFFGGENILTRYNPLSNEVSYITIPAQTIEYYTLLSDGEILYAVSSMDEGIYMWDTHGDFYGKVDYPWDRGGGNVYGFKMVNGNLYFINKKTGIWNMYSKEDKKIKEINCLFVDEEYIETMWKDHVRMVYEKRFEGPLRESEIRLDDYIRQVIEN